MANMEFVKGKMGVELKGEYYNVHPLPHSVDLMVVDEAYMNLDLVMPYFGKTDGVMTKPGYYAVEDDNEILRLVIKDPHDDEIPHYSVDRVTSLDLNSLVERIKSSDFMSPEEIERFNMNSEYRTFHINPEDDFLKVIVKTIINTKKVNLKIFTHKLPEKHSLSNMINSLTGTTKMSVSYFQVWSDILGFDFKLTASDNGEDRIAPLDKDVSYTSVTGEVDFE